MSKKRTKMSDQIREAIEGSGLSRYRICRDTGIDQAAMSRFMAGTGITTDTIDKLADYLDLEIIQKQKRSHENR